LKNTHMQYFENKEYYGLNHDLEIRT
jgi:hypothetical protein